MSGLKNTNQHVALTDVASPPEGRRVPLISLPRERWPEAVTGEHVWLGALAEGDARWNVRRYAARCGLTWGPKIEDQLIALSTGYPSFLRAAC